MTDVNTNNAPNGWYPVDGGKERYWTGTGWSDQVRAGHGTDSTPTPAGSTASAARPEDGAFAAMEGTPNPTAATTFGTVATPSGKRWYGRGWVIAVVALLVGLGLGSAAAGSTDPTGTTEYKAVARDLGSTKDQLASTKSQLDKANADLGKANADLQTVAGRLPQREAQLKTDQAALAKAQATLAADQATLAKKQADVSKREKKVGLVETEIAANTIPGDGIYEVGKDMKAGTYKSAAPDSGNCYSSVNGDANGNDIKSNNNTAGPSVVSVSNGEFFETSGCNEWVLTR